jgi:uncharacterized protein (DUF488 family)
VTVWTIGHGIHPIAWLVATSDDARTAVMCSEAVWWRCHRRMIADRWWRAASRSST